ncbi:MAG: magnesium transporter CorA family protein [Lachnospiraceae bacterium]
MVRIFKTMDGLIRQINETQDGCWVAITAPDEEELLEISNVYHININHLKAPLDEEECSRVEAEDDYIFIIVDIPVTQERKKEEYYVTIPCGIILTADKIFTICLRDTSILSMFIDGRVRNFWTYKKTRFILQILYQNASMYLQYLRIIHKKSSQVEKKLHISTKNRELIELLELKKSLVYFTVSLRSNEIVLEKLLKLDSIKAKPEDEQLLEDIIIENKQAIEMANIYSNILSGTMDAYASVISNNLNIVMKILSVITIVMSIPTIIGSYWGMNVGGIPFANHSHGFLIIVIISIVITLVGGLILGKKNY